MALVGFLLLTGPGLVAVEAVGYTRGGYNSAFWASPLDEKLDHVLGHQWEWWWISIWGLVGLFLLSGGVLGFAYLLADAGAPVIAYVALGGFLVAVLAWVFGLIIQAAAVSEAAKQRQVNGITPMWLHPLWSAGFLAELVWIVGANISYALLGVAVLDTSLVANWAGWVMLVAGAVTSIGFLLARDGFPQLGYLLPAVAGVALLIAGI